MRKILLSAIVIISFIGYAWYIHGKGISSEQTLVIATVGKTKQMPTPTVTPLPPMPTQQLTQPSGESEQPTATPVLATSTPQPSSGYKDGTYSGSVADAFYGNVQVQTTVSGGKITAVNFLQTPSDRDESTTVSQQADPVLSQEAIEAQSASVAIVSGATQTSQAFIKSLQSTLIQAKS